MKSDEDYFSRNMTYFNVFLRILRLGEKCAYFTVFYNGFERTEQLWLVMD